MTTRSGNGRFAPGGPGGPGRPPRGRDEQYREAFREAVSLTAWKAIIRRAVASARKGDRHSREWLSKCLLGNDPVLLDDLAAAVRELQELVGTRPREG